MVLEIFWRCNDSMTLFALSLTGKKQHTNKSIHFSLKTNKQTVLFYLVVNWERVSEFVAGRWDWWEQFAPNVVSVRNSRAGM